MLTTLLFVPLASLQSKEEIVSSVRLIDAPLVSPRSQLNYGKFSMGGRVYAHGIYAGNYRDMTAVFQVPDHVDELRFEIGMNDNASRFRTGTVGVSIDGDPVKNDQVPDGVLDFGKKPISWTIPVADKKSVQFLMSKGTGVGEPTFVRFAKKVDKKVIEKQGANIPQLVSPAEKAVVTGEAAILKWNMVPDALSYGVSIVSLRSQSPLSSTTPRLWCATVTDNRYEFKLSDIPSGEYLWSVVAFGEKKPMGAFSSERLFIVEK